MFVRTRLASSLNASGGGCEGSGLGFSFSASVMYCMPSLWGMFVYSDDTSIDAMMQLVGTSVVSISRMNSLVS